MNINANEFSILSITDAVKLLGNAYVSLIKQGKSPKIFPSVMLWGAPGVGKSQGVRQIGDLIMEKTGKRTVVTDVRLMLFNPVDLRGIPTANADKTLAVWLRPKIFMMDESEDVVNILFLDEISAAPQSIQAAAYQITLDRTVGEHRLPDNCIVIAAGNRVTDRAVAYNMPSALANRLCHIEIESDEKTWHSWAVKAGINKMVVGFLDARPSYLMDFSPQSGLLAFPTPRSWEMVSRILNEVSDNVSEVLALIAGCVGQAAAHELLIWSEIYGSMPAISDIFSGDCDTYPKRPETLYALSSEIVSYAAKHHKKTEIENAVEYVSYLPHEFRDKIYGDFLQIKGARKALSGIKLYDNWFSRQGLYWEDYDI